MYDHWLMDNVLLNAFANKKPTTGHGLVFLFCEISQLFSRPVIINDINFFSSMPQSLER